MKMSEHKYKVGTRVSFFVHGPLKMGVVVGHLRNLTYRVKRDSPCDSVYHLPESSINPNRLRLFRVPVVWEMYGHYEIEAESAEEALELARDEERPLPDEQSYVSASFDVDEEIFWNDPDMCNGEERIYEPL